MARKRTNSTKGAAAAMQVPVGNAEAVFWRCEVSGERVSGEEQFLCRVRECDGRVASAGHDCFRSRSLDLL